MVPMASGTSQLTATVLQMGRYGPVRNEPTTKAHMAHQA